MASTIAPPIRRRGRQSPRSTVAAPCWVRLVRKGIQLHRLLRHDTGWRGWCLAADSDGSQKQHHLPVWPMNLIGLAVTSKVDSVMHGGVWHLGGTVKLGGESARHAGPHRRRPAPPSPDGKRWRGDCDEHLHLVVDGAPRQHDGVERCRPGTLNWSTGASWTGGRAATEQPFSPTRRSSSLARPSPPARSRRTTTPPIGHALERAHARRHRADHWNIDDFHHGQSDSAPP